MFQSARRTLPNAVLKTVNYLDAEWPFSEERTSGHVQSRSPFPPSLCLCLPEVSVRKVTVMPEERPLPRASPGKYKSGVLLAARMYLCHPSSLFRPLFFPTRVTCRLLQSFPYFPPGPDTTRNNLLAYARRPLENVHVPERSNYQNALMPVSVKYDY